MLKISTYQLKTQFQALLAPLRDWLIARHISANSLTLSTCLLCIFFAIFLALPATSTLFLILLPFFMLVRMALNALDGMVAQQSNTQSALGSILNEVCDVVSDIALFGALLFLLPSNWLWAILITLIMLIEFTALAVYQAVSIRPFSGPFGKSDRAVFLAIIGITLLLFPKAESVFLILSSVGVLLSLITISNRFKIGLK